MILEKAFGSKVVYKKSPAEEVSHLEIVCPSPPPEKLEPCSQVVIIVVKIGQEVFHWGFIPAVIYLGFKKGADAGQFVINCLFLSSFVSCITPHSLNRYG